MKPITLICSLPLFNKRHEYIKSIKNELNNQIKNYDNIDASNYKDYVLSMLFVKYLSDTFDESVEELKKQYEGIRLERQIEKLPFRPKILIRDKTKVDMYFDKVVDHSKKKRVLKALKILQKGFSWIFINEKKD